MEDRPDPGIAGRFRPVFAADHDLGPVDDLEDLGLEGVHDELLLDDDPVAVVDPALVDVENGPRELIQRDRIVGAFLDEAEFEISFSRLGFALNGLEIDLTELALPVIFPVHSVGVLVPILPDLFDVGVVAAVDRDLQIEFLVLIHTDVW